MKKTITIVLTFAMLLSLLCTNAFAAVAARKGIYVEDTSKITAVMASPTGTATVTPAEITIDKTVKDLYDGAVRFTLNNPYSGNVMLYVLDSESTPTSENIYYINQCSSSGSVNVYPKDLKLGEGENSHTYYVYLVSADHAFTAGAYTKFTYYEEPSKRIEVTITGNLPTGVDIVIKKDGEQLTQGASSGAKTQDFGDCSEGEYEISAEGFVTWKGTITEESLGEIKLVRVGDLNGDGRDVDGTNGTSDMQCLYTYLSALTAQGELKDDLNYFKAVADINGDNHVDILDYQNLYEMINQPS